MQLLPYSSLTLKSNEPLPDVINKLNAHIEAPKTFRWTFSRNHAPYAGRISSDGFEVRRIIHHRNSFLPTIRGRFESGSQGTVIRITMRLHPLVIGFLVFWYLTWYSATIPLFLWSIFSGDVVIVQGLLFLGLPIVVLFTFWCSFWYEANRSHRELTQIIQGEPLEPPNSSRKIRRSLLLRGVLFVVVIGNIIWHLDEFFPYLKRDTQPVVLKSCSDNSTESSYCNFSVFRTFTGHPTALAIVISADGKTLISGGKDKAIKVWDLQTETFVLSRDRIIGSTDEGIKVWNLETAEREATLEHEKMSDLVVSSDGKLLAGITESSENQESKIKVWRRP
ncbi:WD40 repeat domain-containing protein [Coleofasciculus sp. E1-EBD-02]|uniref:WD40 repeat domain-containing protein n=1 Tax=Coleofasciculus sp. E1-EBD-02 TaxID=3068481 RepID=UPI003302F4DA